MPIRGLTDRKLAFPEIGQIRKGMKVPTKSGGERPMDLKYFRVEFDEQEKERALLFQQVYGDQPDTINILLPFDDISHVWDAYYEAYVASRMIARSDGEKFLYLVDPKTGQIVVQNGMPFTAHRDVVGTYTTTESRQQQDIRMKPTGRLKVVVPELKSLVYLTVHTTSVHDIANISSQLEAIHTLNGGRIAGIPLVLRRRPKKVSATVNGKRQRIEKWLISIEADPTWVKMRLMTMKAAALPGNGLPMLPDAETPELEEPAINQPWSNVEDEEEEAAEVREILNEEDHIPEAEPEPQQEDVFAEFVAKAEKDPMTAFWSLAKAIGVDQDEGKQILSSLNNDAAKGFDALHKRALSMPVQLKAV